MKQLFIEPSTGQVMAIYTHRTTTTSWRKKGYVEVRCPTNINVDRNYVVEVKKGVVTKATPKRNPIQPSVDLEDVKDEARRRIFVRYPDWKQANMISRQMELNQVVEQGGVLSKKQLAERAEINEAWAWIKGIRAASNKLEAMKPIPDDYARNDDYWAV